MLLASAVDSIVTERGGGGRTESDDKGSRGADKRAKEGGYVGAGERISVRGRYRSLCGAETRAKAVGRFLTFRILSHDPRSGKALLSERADSHKMCIKGTSSLPPSLFFSFSVSLCPCSSNGKTARMSHSPRREREDFNKRNGSTDRSHLRRVRCILRLWPPINSTVRILDVATNVVCDDDIDDAFGPRVSRGGITTSCVSLLSGISLRRC